MCKKHEKLFNGNNIKRPNGNGWLPGLKSYSRAPGCGRELKISVAFFRCLFLLSQYYLLANLIIIMLIKLIYIFINLWWWWLAMWSQTNIIESQKHALKTANLHLCPCSRRIYYRVAFVVGEIGQSYKRRRRKKRTIQLKY